MNAPSQTSTSAHDKLIQSLFLTLAVALLCAASAGTAQAQQLFTANLSGAEEVPFRSTQGDGTGTVLLNAAENQITVNLSFRNLTTNATAAHIHGPAAPGTTTGVKWDFASVVPNAKSGAIPPQTFSVTATDVANLRAGLFYFNVHTSTFPPGEIRGQITPECAPPPDDMISWWPADGNAHDIKSGHDGTLNNTTFANGRVGRAFDFTGLPAVTVPDAPALNPQTFSVDAWVTTTNLGCSGCAAFIAAKSGSDGVHGFELAVRETGLLNFSLNDSLNGQFLSSTVGIADGSFHHVAATYDGSTMKLYIDGVLNNQTSVSSAINYEAGRPLVIGGREFGLGGSTATYPGLIDELELFDRALDAGEIAAIFKAGVTGKCRECTEPPADLVSWWTGNRYRDDIQGTNHATLLNGAFFADGKVGSAFSFDGTNDFVEAPDSPSLSITGAISIDAWVKPDTTAGNQIILSKYDGSANQYSYALGVDGGQVHFFVYQTGDGSVYRGVQTTTSIPANSFTHVAATFDPSTQDVKIYLNGVAAAAPLYAGSSNVTSIFDGTAPLRIGAVKNSSAGILPFDGIIDEAQVFDRALTATEIRAIADAGSAGKCAVDLALTKTADADPILINEHVNYTLTVANNGTMGATGVQVVDQLPAGLTYVSDTNGACTFDSGTNKLTCPLGDMLAGATQTFNVLAQGTTAGRWNNFARVSSPEPDKRPGNDKQTLRTVVISLRSLGLSRENATGGCAVAQTLTGTVTLTDPAPASGVNVLLSSSDEGAATVPASVLVAAGQRSATFDVTPQNVSTLTNVTVTARLHPTTGPQLNVAFTVTPLRVRTLVLGADQVTGGDTLQNNVVTLTCAPAQDTPVALSSNRQQAQVPSGFLVPAGQLSNTFEITTQPVGSQQKAVIKAVLNDRGATDLLLVNPPPE